MWGFVVHMTGAHVYHWYYAGVGYLAGINDKRVKIVLFDSHDLPVIEIEKPPPEFHER